MISNFSTCHNSFISVLKIYSHQLFLETYQKIAKAVVSWPRPLHCCIYIPLSIYFMHIAFTTTSPVNCIFIFYHELLSEIRKIYILTVLYIAVRILKYVNTPLKYTIKASYVVILNIYLSYLKVTFCNKLKFTNPDSVAKWSLITFAIDAHLRPSSQN